MGAGASVLIVSGALDAKSPLIPLAKLQRLHSFDLSVSALLSDMSFNVLDASDPSAPPTRCLSAAQLSSLPTPFLDADFDRRWSLLPSLSAADRDPDPSVSWMSVSSLPIFPPSHPSSSTPPYNTVVQGAMGDCFLVASLASLFSHRSQGRHLSGILSDPDDDGAERLEAAAAGEGAPPGKFQVRLYRFGRPTYVTVDSLLPVRNDGFGGQRPIYAYSRSPDLGKMPQQQQQQQPQQPQAKGPDPPSPPFSSSFAPLVEKAFVKSFCRGLYAALRGGSTAEALYDLLGVGVADYHLDSASEVLPSSEGVKGTVVEAFKDGKFVTTGIISQGDDKRRNAAVEKLKLRPNHAYAVVGVADDEVSLYNPQGHDDCFGRKNASDGLGTLRVKWADFCSAFNRLQVAGARGESEQEPVVWEREWDDVNRNGGSTNFPNEFRHNDVLILTEGDDKSWAELELMLGQEDGRFRAFEKGEKLSYEEIGITVVALASKPGSSNFHMLTPEQYKVVAKTRSFANKRETSLLLKREDLFPTQPGGSSASSTSSRRQVGVVFSTFKPGIKQRYWCSLRLPCCPLSPSQILSPIWASSALSLWSAHTVKWTGKVVDSSTRLDLSFPPALLSLARAHAGLELMTFLSQTGDKAAVPVGCWCIVSPKSSARTTEEDSSPSFAVATAPSFVKGSLSSTLLFVSSSLLRGEGVGGVSEPPPPEDVVVSLVPCGHKSGASVSVSLEVRVRVVLRVGGSGKGDESGATDETGLALPEEANGSIGLTERKGCKDPARELHDQKGRLQQAEGNAGSLKKGGVAKEGNKGRKGSKAAMEEGLFSKSKKSVMDLSAMYAGLE